MVKLLRLTTEREDANFDIQFNEDIIIKPKSQIALKNLTLTMDEDVLKIDNQNNIFTFSTDTRLIANKRTTTLHNDTYKYNETDDLFLTLAEFLNSKLQADDDDNDFNTQIVCKVNKNNFFEIIQFKSILFNFVPSLATTTTDIDIDRSIATRIEVSQTESATITQKHKLIFEDKFIKGAGVFRCRISNFVDNSSGVDDNGFEIGLSDTNPTGWINNENMTDDERTFAIKFNRVGSAYVYKDYGSVETTSAINAVNAITATISTNDILEIKLTKGEIIGHVYIHNGATYIKNQLFRNTLYGDLSPDATRPNGLTAFHNLYPYIIMHGDTNEVIITDIQHSLEEKNMENYTQRINQDMTLPYVNIPQIAEPPNLNINKRYTDSYNYNGSFSFKNVSIANYFGFERTTLNASSDGYQQNGTFKNIVFTATSLFKPAIYSRNFIIEMLNIPLTSYDSLYNGRKSILASVVDGNDITLNGTDIVVYEPSEITYIDIDNMNSLNLRNIKLKVVDKNLNAIKIQGLGVITILIKEP